MQAITNNMTMGDWQNKIGTWASKTFNHNERGIAIHLLREAVELCHSVGINTEELTGIVATAIAKTSTEPANIVAEEAADVAILNYALADYLGFNLEMSVEAKHTVNIARSWGTPDHEGVTEHID